MIRLLENHVTDRDMVAPLFDGNVKDQDGMATE